VLTLTPIHDGQSDVCSRGWHLFTPPLLSLLDDPDTAIRVAGCRLSSGFLKNLSWDVVAHTGLFDLFLQAVFPTVLLLPNLTPEGDSVSLLRAGYQALFDLVALEPRRPINIGKQSIGVKAREGSIIKAYDKIIREGIFVGFDHAGERPVIAQILMETLERVISGLGLDTAKHLKV
jgi:hypothetical protein